jgi:hypothetical protein
MMFHWPVRKRRAGSSLGLILLLAVIVTHWNGPPGKHSCNAYTPQLPSSGGSGSSSSSSSRRQGPFLRRQDMTGIWRLTQQKLWLPKQQHQQQHQQQNAQTAHDASADALGAVSQPEATPSSSSTAAEDIVVRLNEDGTFDPYTAITEHGDEGVIASYKDHNLERILGRGGSWEFRDGTLMLAAGRPDNADPSKVHDTLLTGRLTVHVSECLPSTDQQPMALDDNADDSPPKGGLGTDDASRAGNVPQKQIDVHLSIPSGTISIGKFMYPRKHKAFFDDPMLFSESSIGTFQMKQLLGNLNARLQREHNEEGNKPEPKYHKRDFYERRFYLTATPHGVNPGYAAEDKHYDADKVKYDVRVMPITFHSNNTFTAVGAEKILRGRFGITGTAGDKLWFQVYLFGFGRSAPGSVFSEGRLLSHDDKRGYLGRIQDVPHPNRSNQTIVFVDGEFYYGTDLKRTNKAHSWGSFSLQEIYNEDENDDNEEEDDDEDEDDKDIEDFRGRLEDAFQ